MKAFKFKQFEIRQREDVFRVGTDGVLLGALCTCEGQKKALEIGSGTGLISLMVAQRNPQIEIEAVEIDPQAEVLTRLNFKNSPFSSRLKSRCADFTQLQLPPIYDLIFSNPPYFYHREGKDLLARHQVTLNFKDLVMGVAQALVPEGLFSVVLPASEKAGFVGLCAVTGLSLMRKVEIRNKTNAPVVRHILEFRKTEIPMEVENSSLILKDEVGGFSEAYRKLTMDFHPMF